MKHEPRPGEILAGKYRVRSILGRARGTLVEAEHTAFEQRVAIRVVSPQLGDEVEIARFRREARALAKLGSEHVARIIDVGTLPDGSFYLVRQYLEGLDMGRYLKGKRALAVEEAVGWILQATEAVAECHAYGIVLRELAPAHLFLADRSPGVRGGPRVLKIIDFGTSKLLRENSDAAVEEFTATAVMGLSPYSSPEMMRKQKDLDVRTDVWSLGAILYEMLSGRPPFGSDTLALAVAISRVNPAPLSRERRDVPKELDEAISRALTKDKHQRTSDTHAFAASLARFAPRESRALMERIRDLAASARERTNGDAEDELEISDVEELSNDDSEDVATRVGRPADFAASLGRGATVPLPSPSANTQQLPNALSAGVVDEQTNPQQNLRQGAGGPPAPRVMQEKTEALGVNFQALLASPHSPHVAPRPPASSAGDGPVFAGAATGLSVSSGPKSTQVLPALLDPPTAPPPHGLQEAKPMAPSSPSAPGSQPGWSNARASHPAIVAGPPSIHSKGAGGSVGAAPWANPPIEMPPSGGRVEPGRFGRKIALMVVVGAASALALMIVVLLVLRGGHKNEVADSSAVNVDAPVTAPAQDPRPAMPTATSEPSATATSEPSAVATTEPVTTPTSDPATTSRPKPTATAATPTATAPPVATVKPTTTAPTPTATSTAATSSSEQGTLVLIAVGGTCAFSVNGAPKGTTNSVKLTVPPGNYAVTCKPASGSSRSKSGAVKGGKTTMMTFKL
jgi:serine/threonine-protein kinase